MGPKQPHVILATAFKYHFLNLSRPNLLRLSEAELIRRGFAKVGITMTDYLRGAVLDYSKAILGNLSDRAEDRV